ncbi:helix-turn-helix domain-containing protein [Facilibium subflavum]|uniref:helix-turn-helix domain-containing protein n=1 Tax=Facilibium subflavum TaxID=2219058 RepID=UPI000E65718F|nr:helix-turn-helix domain-containing protein [Facilibium subflavum]
MANQYADSFKNHIEKLSGNSIEKVLKDCHLSGMSYAQVAKRYGYQTGTVRKWCRRYAICLAAASEKKGSNQEGFDLHAYVKAQIHQKPLNNFNVLSKKWLHFKEKQ